jgi:hypothetical protein
MHNVNPTSNAFGNGIFDGVQDGWNDAQGSENGDKCMRMGTQNIALAGGLPGRESSRPHPRRSHFER